jgi:iron complex outermembrane receptor protein
MSQMTMSPRSVFSRALSALLIVSSGFLWSSAARADEAKRAFDIPAGRAEVTLAKFADQSGTQFFFTAEKVGGVRTQAAQGSFTPREALDRMLAGTQLVAVQDEKTGAYTVRREATVADAEKNVASRPIDDRAAVKPAEEVLVLTPFEVDARNDSRYRAAGTLAGSRLNTSLKDIAAVIDVYTKDFITDLGATNLEQVLNYGNNIERDTEDTITGQGNVNISTGNSYRYRIRGLPASRARNYFDFDYPIDTYNTERLDESRGPNSILFGFGSPGGIVNVSTKQALLTRDLAEVEFSAGTEIDHRVTIDLNKALLDGKLGIRFNALDQEKTGWRHFTFEDLQAYSLAVKAKPFSKTTVSLEYERFLDHDNVARPLTFWSQTDTWDAAGKPLINTNFAGRTNTTLNPGLNAATIAQVSGSNTWIYTQQNGALLNWRGMSRSNRATYTAANGQVYTAFNDFRSQVLSPDGILEVNTMGPGTGRQLVLDAFYASVQQEITKKFLIEFALTKQYSDWESLRIPATTVFGDPNAFLPAGGAGSTGPAAASPVANPFAGKYYVETVPQFWRTTADTLNYRATASYELDTLPAWAGKHRFGFLAERDRYEILTRTQQELMLVNGAPISTLPANVANGFTRRYYIMDPANPQDYRNADIVPPTPIDVTLADGTRLTSRLFNYTSAPADYTKEDDILMAVAQSRWWNDRIHTIIGIRKDDVVFDDWGSYVADNQGGYTRSAANRTDVPYEGMTRNYGVVYHAFDWLSAFANYSTSLGVPSLKVIYAPTGAFMDPMEGEGKDLGLKFSIPKFRVEGMVSYFEASSTNDTDTQNVEGWGVNGNNNFLDALVGAGFMTAAQATPLRATGTGDTVDSQSQGVELSLSGSLTPNWDVRFNYSHTERSLSNAFPRVNAWAADTLRPFWATWNRDNPNTVAADNILDTVFSGTTSLRDIINTFETNLATRTATRTKVTGLRPDKANIFTTYAFKAGALRGLRVGGGIRYESANYAGQDAAGNVVKGKASTNLDLMAAYTRKIWNRPFTFQVNARDVTRDEPYVTPAVLNASGNADTIIINPPRQVTFSVRVAL